MDQTGDEDLMEVEPPKSPTNGQNNKSNNTKQPNNLSIISIRQPPPGWLGFRKSIISKSKSSNIYNKNEIRTNEQDTTKGEIPFNRIIIRGIRSISTKEFEDM